jgi:hypothetical protein
VDDWTGDGEERQSERGEVVPGCDERITSRIEWVPGVLSLKFIGELDESKWVESER